MSIGKIVLRTLGVLVLVGCVALLAALYAYRDIPAAELEAKYAGPASRFITIEGVRIHYRDEGSGPAVVLVHANFSNLIDWDPWVDALKDRYRVVRFDLTSHGLTGPDPTGDYTLGRTLELTGKVIDALGLKTFTMGGTSLGGTVAIRYAVGHPDRVQRLVLLSPGSLEGREQKARGDVPRAAYVLKYILPRALPEYMLRSGFGDPSKLPESLVDRWYDMWMREGQREAQLDRLTQYKPEGIEDVIRAIRVPVLLLWGEANTTAKFEQNEEFRELLSGAPSVTFISYPGVGHMAVEEAGVETGRDGRAWLDAQTGVAAVATAPGG